ncbi:efflux RND transporter periplasmic adaptor subunit [Rhodocyclaceae bacterium]
MRVFLPFLLVCLPWPAWAAEIQMLPEQITRMGIVVQAAGKAVGGGGMRLPAQVTIPPVQIEVVAAPLPAMVANVRVAYGDTVKKGQVLARLQGASFLEAQREYSHAQAQANLATESRQRDEALFADGIIAQSRLSATIAAERQATALAAEKRQSLRLAGMAEPSSVAAPAGGAELRAPFDGVVLETAAQPGLRVDALTPLFKLGRLAPLWLEIQASAAQAAGVAPGDTVVVPGCTAPAKVVLVAPQMQMASQSLLIRAELAKPAGCVKPFQFVQAQVMPSKGLLTDVWRLPTTALVRHQDRVWVFVAADGGFQPVPVKILDESADATSIAADLPTTARVAVKGVAAIKAVWLGLGAGEE